MASWRDEFEECAKGDEIIACTLSEEEMDAPMSGKCWTAWSADYVYFPVEYDGDVWIGRVPRNPCDEATCPVGG